MRLADLAVQLKKEVEEDTCPLNGDIFDDEEEDETAANLSEALGILEDAHALLDALLDPQLNPKGKINPYFKREITRVRKDAIDLLIQYDFSGDDIVLDATTPD